MAASTLPERLDGRLHACSGDHVFTLIGVGHESRCEVCLQGSVGRVRFTLLLLLRVSTTQGAALKNIQEHYYFIIIIIVVNTSPQ